MSHSENRLIYLIDQHVFYTEGETEGDGTEFLVLFVGLSVGRRKEDI
jgi:hypothetical protein